MTAIIPAILTESFEDLRRQIRRVDGLFPFVHLDVMDGEFVRKKSFFEVEKIPGIGTSLQYELHLMVNSPLTEMKKWQHTPNVSRVIIHRESPASVEECRAFAKAHSWEFGMALNPDTPLEVAIPYFKDLDYLLFMTVFPGRQGAPFQESVLPKIRQFLSHEGHPRFGVDGGINSTTIHNFRNLNADFLDVGSALMLAPDIEKAYLELKNALSS
ncbi:MAG: hypothetical protein AAB467_00455 [Patescibacteria group bacterium]